MRLRVVVDEGEAPDVTSWRRRDPRRSTTTPTPTPTDDRMLTMEDVAAHLQVNYRTLKRHIGRLTGDAAPIVIGGLDRPRRRWRRDQLVAIEAAYAIAVAPSEAIPTSKPRKPRTPKAKAPADAPTMRLIDRVRGHRT
jgi:hypothetical protein